MRTFFLRIRTDRISLFRFLLEGYDGLAVLTTVDVEQGLVRLTVPKDRYAELWALLAAISGELALNTARQLPKNAKSPTMRHS